MYPFPVREQGVRSKTLSPSRVILYLLHKIKINKFTLFKEIHHQKFLTLPGKIVGKPTLLKT
jgi:hypothetical protein